MPGSLHLPGVIIASDELTLEVGRPLAFRRVSRPLGRFSLAIVWQSHLSAKGLSCPQDGKEKSPIHINELT